ncbi:MAG TPA: rhomboid family intramembrane serine protease, partial [Myxococcales bacterium]|nr:rhomboid family intramembrane serine protease [Myxococcales bacterium]
MFFPLRVEEATVDRLPVVSIGIAGLCALAFALTWILPANPTGVRGEQVRDIVRYYGEHPYLNLPESFARDYLNDAAAERVADLHQDPPASLDALTLQMEQRHLDSMLDGFEAEASASALRRFALVPARGILQPGWLTAMFLHFGWMHILGNLFFFYLVGPLLEDLWGRAFFAGFYLLGGLVAAMAHFGMDPHSTVPMAGASGAIAACMGAFTWRCAARKIRIAYWFGWFIRGTFLLPAWAWGGIWFALEVLSFALHASGGVAVMAHIGGFIFGFAGAVALEKTGFEARSLAPAVKAQTEWTQHQGIDAARAALEGGDRAGAAAAYRQVLEERPLDREAAVGLAGLEQDLGPALPLLESLVVRRDFAQAWELALELGAAFDPGRVPDKLAWQLAGAAQDAPEAVGDLPERLDVALASRRGPLAAKALLRAARRALASGRTEAARSWLAEARALPGLLPELAQQIDAAAASCGPAAADAAPIVERTGPAPAAAQPQPAAVRILACRLVRLAEDALHLEAAGGQARRLEFSRLVGVGAAVVKTDEGVAILTDLVLRWGDGAGSAAAVRIP